MVYTTREVFPDQVQVQLPDGSWVLGVVPLDPDTGELAAGGSGGGGAGTVADGADVAEGSTTDAAVTTNTTGTISGKLRGLVAILADVWDSVNHRLSVAIARTMLANATATIAASGTTSGSVDARGAAMLGVVLPSTFLGTALSFQVSADNSTFRTLNDRNGSAVTVPTVAQANGYDLPGEIAAWPYFKIVSNATESAQRDITVVMKG